MTHSLLDSCRHFGAVTLVAGTLGLAPFQVSGAEAPIRYNAQPSSNVKIDGTSTLHDWTVEGQIIGGYIEFSPSFATDPFLKNTTVTPKLEVMIPVRSLKSGKRGMDAVMHEAMKQKDHPRVEYRLLSMKPKTESASSGGTVEFDTQGTLTVAGVTRTNNMVVKMETQDASKLRFTGNTALKMTEFGIQPPSPSVTLGLIKTGDDVKISFEWLTAKVSEKPKS